MNNKIIGYAAAIIIGIGFIMMAASNTLNSEVASVLQAVLGAVFIVAGIIKIVSELKRND